MDPEGAAIEQLHEEGTSLGGGTGATGAGQRQIQQRGRGRRKVQRLRCRSNGAERFKSWPCPLKAL